MTINGVDPVTGRGSPGLIAPKNGVSKHSNFRRHLKGVVSPELRLPGHKLVAQPNHERGGVYLFCRHLAADINCFVGFELKKWEPAPRPTEPAPQGFAVGLWRNIGDTHEQDWSRKIIPEADGGGGRRCWLTCGQ